MDLDIAFCCLAAQPQIRCKFHHHIFWSIAVTPDIFSISFSTLDCSLSVMFAGFPGLGKVSTEQYSLYLCYRGLINIKAFFV
uniref:Uncharacterized protein n=1 Tax=Pyxicephalus adspersus TaxID=30357 RepID=A0AAV2ZLC3_PYXAD|nr:TPA: hypothetical protein GDO54_003585 [Pyxicephalus adspersus]